MTWSFAGRGDSVTKSSEATAVGSSEAFEEFYEREFRAQRGDARTRPRSMSARRILLAVAIAVGLALGRPTVVLAHAGFVSSTPASGIELGSAAGAVTLRFSEPLNVRLSESSVTTPDGNHLDGRWIGPQEL